MSSIAMRSPYRTAVPVIAAAMLAALTAVTSAESIQSERLRLRPLKEPAHCVDGGTCPLVASPRIGHRRSTIPGVSNPDHGRPKVTIIGPPGKPATPGFRSYGGNYGIVGGP